MSNTSKQHSTSQRAETPAGEDHWSWLTSEQATTILRLWATFSTVNPDWDDDLEYDRLVAEAHKRARPKPTQAKKAKTWEEELAADPDDGWGDDIELTDEEWAEAAEDQGMPELAEELREKHAAKWARAEERWAAAQAEKRWAAARKAVATRRRNAAAKVQPVDEEK